MGGPYGALGGMPIGGGGGMPGGGGARAWFDPGGAGGGGTMPGGAGGGMGIWGIPVEQKISLQACSNKGIVSCTAATYIFAWITSMAIYI